MKTLTRKGFGRIYVAKETDVKLVKAIIKELDEFEFDYLPGNLVAPFSEYPNLVWTGKFDGLCMNRLTGQCWSRGVYIWVLDNGHEEFLTNPRAAEGTPSSVG